MSEGSAFRKGLETAPQLQKAFLIGFAQAAAVAAAPLTPLEPGNLRVFHVAAGSHAEKRLELRVEDRHLHIVIVQRSVCADRFLVSRLSLGAVKARGLDGLQSRRQKDRDDGE